MFLPKESFLKFSEEKKTQFIKSANLYLENLPQNKKNLDLQKIPHIKFFKIDGKTFLNHPNFKEIKRKAIKSIDKGFALYKNKQEKLVSRGEKFKKELKARENIDIYFCVCGETLLEIYTIETIKKCGFKHIDWIAINPEKPIPKIRGKNFLLTTVPWITNKKNSIIEIRPYSNAGFIAVNYLEFCVYGVTDDSDGYQSNYAKGRKFLGENYKSKLINENQEDLIRNLFNEKENDIEKKIDLKIVKEKKTTFSVYKANFEDLNDIDDCKDCGLYRYLRDCEKKNSKVLTRLIPYHKKKKKKIYCCVFEKSLLNKKQYLKLNTELEKWKSNYE